MRALLLLIVSTLTSPLLSAADAELNPHERQAEVVTVPVVERAASHHEYANTLLRLALDLTTEEFGPYRIRYYNKAMTIRRQLVALDQGDSISVALSMPSASWLEKADMVQFPLLKGLASYRLFFVRKTDQDGHAAIHSLNELRALKIGQGRGWSTAKILEDNKFEVVYGESYKHLFPMLKTARFDALMRGVYEIEAEFKTYSSAMPELAIAENFAVYTYLPMYFFVNKRQVLLAERLEAGLKKAHATGQIDKVFNRYFGRSVQLLTQKKMQIFYLSNTNINNSFLAHDRPYLLNMVEP
ncbi:extracellular solute-binding protein, family 3 [Alteromonadaceae bacterium Bs31]|nr:extracellular solute-binding protein, family 3 [Alteromonadaceae bacterium Bs31]